jgi:uncharacterized phiE125 gp8 family phage protein
VTRTLVTASETEPISLAEAKLFLRVDIADDDVLIEHLIQAAREMVESISRRALVSQTWNYILDNWPGGDTITLPLPPLQSVEEITYLDQDGDESTFSSDSYVVNTDAEPGKVVLAYGESWPDESLYPTGAITVQFICGYGDAIDVPEKYRLAMRLLINHWYENREAVQTTGAMPKEVPLAVEALLWLDRNMGFP